MSWSDFHGEGDNGRVGVSLMPLLGVVAGSHGDSNSIKPECGEEVEEIMWAR